MLECHGLHLGRAPRQRSAAAGSYDDECESSRVCHCAGGAAQRDEVSRASALNVLLHYQLACFMMVIADNGIGFVLDNPVDHRQTLGIQSIHHRASLLDIDTAPQEGCRITLEMCREELYLN
jgi:signal transduction histidine kinase